jgi:hypothetical protein
MLCPYFVFVDALNVSSQGITSGPLALTSRSFSTVTNSGSSVAASASEEEEGLLHAAVINIVAINNAAMFS